MDRIDKNYVRNAALASNALFQSKWRLEILCAMRSDSVRLGQLSRLIPAASKKMLAHNLRKLEANGIIIRKDKSSAVLHIEYELNENMRDEVCSLLDHMASWGRLHLNEQSETSVPEGSHPPLL